MFTKVTQVELKFVDIAAASSRSQVRTLLEIHACTEMNVFCERHVIKSEF